MSLFLLAVLLVALTGCGDDAATLNGDTLTRTAATTVYTSVNQAVAASLSKSRGLAPVPLDVDWTNLAGTVHVVGTLTYAVDSTTYSLTVTFNGHTATDGSDSYTLTGEVTYGGDTTDTTWNFNFGGDLEVLFGGETHEYEWTIAMARNIVGENYVYSYTGNYTLDGVSSSYSYTWQEQIPY